MPARRTGAPTPAAPPTSRPAQSLPTLAADATGSTGERLTRDEAFDLLRRAVASLVHNENSVRASAVRSRARELLGRDSESLNERNFIRILKDAHDAEVVDLRRRGDDFEVGRAENAPSVGDQLAKAEPPPAPRSDFGAPTRLSLRGRGSGPRGRMPSVLPPELLSLGVVQPALSSSVNGTEEIAAPPPPTPGAPARPGPARKRGARKRGGKVAAGSVVAEDAAPPRGAKRPRRPRAKKSATKSGDA